MLCFAPNGNIGIGNANPQRKLHISSGNPQLLLEDGNTGDGGVINFGNTGHGVGRNTGVGNFTGGNDVVLWTAGDGHCGLATGGGSLRVSSNGNVGIGNLNPQYLLSVGNAGVGGSDGKISIGKNNGGGGSRFFTVKYNANFDMCFSDSDNNDVLKLSYNAPADTIVANINGNVGIGTPNPVRKLHVAGDINYTGGLFLNNSAVIFDDVSMTNFNSKLSGKAGANVSINASGVISSTLYTLPIATTGTIGGVRVGTGGGINIDGNGTITTTTAFTNILTSSGTGMFQVVVSAGTQLNSPTLGKLFITTISNSLPQIENNTMVNHLEVNGSSRINGRLHIVEQNGTGTSATNGSIVIDHQNSGGASSITFTSAVNRGSDFGYIQYQDSLSGGESARLFIGTSNDGDDHLILQPSGNVGIGDQNPSQKLTVAGNINASGNITSSTINANNIASGGNLSCSALYVGGFSSVGGDTWHNGGGRPVFYFGGDGRNYYRTNGWDGHNWRNNNDVTVMFLNSGGDLYCGRFINWSDTRIKKDIVDISDTEALDKILLIEPKKYKYIDEVGKGTNEVIGFIAQQIKEVIPEAVSLGEGTLPNGDIIQDFHYLDKLTIFTLNVCATQELHRIITRQQTVIDSLILRLEALENS